MKKLTLLSIILISCLLNAKSMDPKISDFVKKVEWSGQASVTFTLNEQRIYIDPFHLKSTAKADIIFVTHSHGDHFSIDDIKSVANESTKIYAPESCLADLSSNGFKPTGVKPGDNISVNGVKVEVVPSYNIVKKNHPKSNNWVGYVLEGQGIKVYHPGDTERIPEMKKIDCDIAFMPLGQKYTMVSVDDAVQSVIDVRAEVAIPFHYGMYEGKDEDAVEFKEKLKGKAEVVILER